MNVAIEEIERGSGKQFDRDVVMAFTKACKNGDIFNDKEHK